MRLVKAQWQALEYLINVLNDETERTANRTRTAQLILDRADVQQVGERAGLPTHLIIKYIEGAGAVIPHDNLPQEIIDLEPPPEEDA